MKCWKKWNRNLKSKWRQRISVNVSFLLKIYLTFIGSLDGKCTLQSRYIPTCITKKGICVTKSLPKPKVLCWFWFDNPARPFLYIKRSRSDPLHAISSMQTFNANFLRVECELENVSLDHNFMIPTRSWIEKNEQIMITKQFMKTNQH